MVKVSQSWRWRKRARRETAGGFRHASGGAVGIPTVLCACCVWACAALAQTPFISDEWKFGRRQEGSTLNYCVDARDPDFPVARKIGAAIAVALLLQPKEHVMGKGMVVEDLDNLYQVFLETCDVYLGFKLIPDAYPNWMKITRPYYRGSFVLAVTDPGWASLADMPTSHAIGSTIGTSADLRVAQYLMALREDARWARFPMSSDEATLRALLKNSIGAALIWGPSLWALKRSDPAFARLRVISLHPLPASTADVGAAILANESFLRRSVDQAVASLNSDGTIQSILDGLEFPATAVK